MVQKAPAKMPLSVFVEEKFELSRIVWDKHRE